MIFILRCPIQTTSEVIAAARYILYELICLSSSWYSGHMQKVSPMIQQIGHLIDKRFQTFEINIKAEIKASEERVTGKLTKKLQILEDKLDGKVNNHEERIERLEAHTGLATSAS